MTLCHRLDVFRMNVLIDTLVQNFLWFVPGEIFNFSVNEDQLEIE